MRLLLLSLALGAVVLGGCAPASDDSDDLLDEEAEAGEDAFSAQAIQRYGAVSPPERRFVTTAMTPRIGERLAVGTRLAVIRTLVHEGTNAKLVVDVDTATTALVEAGALASSSRPALDADGFAESSYVRSLAELATSSKALASIDRDATIDARIDEPFALTIDMCQSRKAWDKALFEWAVRLSDELRAPVPIGIAMTGGWATAHPNELGQIVAWQRAGKLAITWINHSSTHPLHCQDSSCQRASFLTAPGVDFDEEVLGLERSLLARGLLPSVIFRFPGLVHDANRLRQLSRLSLMALDADAWIAKGQGIRPRAVVLVHGNGNEPPGITGFLRSVEAAPRAANLRSGKSALVSPLLVAPVPPSAR